MSLRLYNTLSRTKEELVPLDPKNVRMYVCGPTVYDFAHIGNARPAIVFDVLFRLLRHIYGESHVTYVRNVTDIDDKINARALERRGDRNVPILDVVRELTEETYGVYRADVAALGNLPPTHMPRATENVGPMIAMIERLIAAGHAYEASGHVLFDVSSKPDYGKLSRRTLDDMIAGSRVEVAPYKKNPMDFVLWKPSDAQTPGWESPWGRGRPGWHIECSSMIESGFPGTDTIDIHGGGIDLVFPHHENEIAQSEGVHHNHPLAKIWMHNGFLNVEGEKMSKSLGNFVTINELLQDWPGEVLRFAMLQTNYREPINWTNARMKDAWRELSSLIQISYANSSEQFKNARHQNRVQIKPDDLIMDALADDLNTSLAITRLRELAKRIIVGDREAAESLNLTLSFLGVYRFPYHFAYELGHASSFGSAGEVSPNLLFKYIDTLDRARAIVLNNYYFSSNYNERIRSLQSVNDLVNQLDPRMANDGVKIDVSERCDVSLVAIADTARRSAAEIERLIEARLAARKAKNFTESDRIRDGLLAQGIVLKDNKDGTTSWEVKR